MIKQYTDEEGIDLFITLTEDENGVGPDGVILSVADGLDISPPIFIPRLELLFLLEAI